MEKLVYLVWKRGEEPEAALAGRLLGEAIPRLRQLGAERLRVAVVDDDVAAGQALRLGQMRPAKSGMVSFWLEQSQERGPLEDVLRTACERIAGYLVVESRPLIPDSPRAAPGERSPGFSLVTGISPRDGLTHEEFIHLWYTLQRDMAIETQSTVGYIRNEVVRPLTPGAPDWAAIVEEAFPIGALDDPAVFYDAVDDPEKLARNQKRMFETVQKFLALDRVDSHPMSEYDFS
jgi:hypothetical protein